MRSENNRYTPLHVAAYKGNADGVRILLSARADARQRDNDGRTALDIARQREHDPCVAILQKHLQSLPPLDSGTGSSNSLGSAGSPTMSAYSAPQKPQFASSNSSPAVLPAMATTSLNRTKSMALPSNTAASLGLADNSGILSSPPPKGPTPQQYQQQFQQQQQQYSNLPGAGLVTPPMPNYKSLTMGKHPTTSLASFETPLTSSSSAPTPTPTTSRKVPSLSPMNSMPIQAVNRPTSVAGQLPQQQPQQQQQPQRQQQQPQPQDTLIPTQQQSQWQPQRPVYNDTANVSSAAAAALEAAMFASEVVYDRPAPPPVASYSPTSSATSSPIAAKRRTAPGPPTGAMPASFGANPSSMPSSSSPLPPPIQPGQLQRRLSQNLNLPLPPPSTTPPPIGSFNLASLPPPPPQAQFYTPPHTPQPPQLSALGINKSASASYVHQRVGHDLY